MKMTLLDPHPANNDYGLNASFSPTGFALLESSYTDFQAATSDGPVIIPSRVNQVEDFYQQTDYSQLQLSGLEGTINLQGLSTGLLQIEGANTQVTDYPLTGPGTGHTEVHDWYQTYVVPSLATGGLFLPPLPLSTTFQALSPVALLITDPQGRRLGYDPTTGAPVNDFGSLATDSGAGTEPEKYTISMGSVIPGLYQVQGVGTGSGPYHIELQITREDNPSQPLFDQTIASGTASPGQPIPPVVAFVTSLTLSGTSVAEFRPTGTVVGTLAAPEYGSGHTLAYSLVSGTGSADNASFTVSGDQLLTADAFDFAAKSSYSVRVRATDEAGNYFEQPFTITVTDDPALARTGPGGRTLAVSGTARNDAFSFAAGAVRHAMTLNGVALAVDAATVDAVAFSGGGGSDSATLFAGSGGANTLSLAPAGGTLSGPGYQVTLSGAAQVVAVGHAADRAYFTGSAGNDVFVGTPDYAYLHGPGYFNQADGFGVALATGAGGNDSAYFTGSAGNDVFVGTPTYAYLYGAGFWNQANGFPVAVGTAGPGGSDYAYLYGAAAGGNVFVGTPAYAYLRGAGFWNQADGFKVVVGTAAGAGNAAYLYGSAAGGNVFVATPAYAYLYGGGFFNQADGFQTAVGNAAGPGDAAYLYDTGGGTFVATSAYAYVTGSGLLEWADGFASVRGYSGGGDTAYLYGTLTAADTYVDAGSYAYLYGDAFFVLESGFASVWANPYAHH
jgi:hypothetical protein